MDVTNFANRDDSEDILTYNNTAGFFNAEGGPPQQYIALAENMVVKTLTFNIRYPQYMQSWLKNVYLKLGIRDKGGNEDNTVIPVIGTGTGDSNLTQPALRFDLNKYVQPDRSVILQQYMLYIRANELQVQFKGTMTDRRAFYDDGEGDGHHVYITVMAEILNTLPLVT